MTKPSERWHGLAGMNHLWSDHHLPDQIMSDLPTSFRAWARSVWRVSLDLWDPFWSTCKRKWRTNLLRRQKFFLHEKLARSAFVQRIGHCPPEIGKMVIKALKRDDDGGGLMMMMIKCSLQAPTILFPSKYDFHKIMPIWTGVFFPIWHQLENGKGSFEGLCSSASDHCINLPHEIIQIHRPRW